MEAIFHKCDNCGKRYFVGSNKNDTFVYDLLHRTEECDKVYPEFLKVRELIMMLFFWCPEKLSGVC